jgi:hypothetical protein
MTTAKEMDNKLTKIINVVKIAVELAQTLSFPLKYSLFLKSFKNKK